MTATTLRRDLLALLVYLDELDDLTLRPTVSHAVLIPVVFSVIAPWDGATVPFWLEDVRALCGAKATARQTHIAQTYIKPKCSVCRERLRERVAQGIARIEARLAEAGPKVDA